MKQHKYKVNLEWTGNSGNGTQNYSSYERSHSISVEQKYDYIKGSSDPSFRGDSTLYNPEELFLSSLSSCHMLWYLHLCTVNHITVLEYSDSISGVMEENQKGGGKFISAQLNPKIRISEEKNIPMAIELHKAANEMCFIANSCNFTISHKPEVWC